MKNRDKLINALTAYCDEIQTTDCCGDNFILILFGDCELNERCRSAFAGGDKSSMIQAMADHIASEEELYQFMTSIMDKVKQQRIYIN